MDDVKMPTLADCATALDQAKLMEDSRRTAFNKAKAELDAAIDDHKAALKAFNLAADAYRPKRPRKATTGEEGK